MHQNTSRKSIVLGASYVALGVIKAFAKVGISVILMYTEPNDHAYHSRFISQRIRIPNPLDDSAGLLRLLMETDENWDGALLIPTLDEFVIFISQNSSALKKKYVFTVRDWDITKRIINKNMLYPQAQSIGIPTPKFFFPDSVEYITEKQNELFYPCILKPYETHKFDRIYRSKVLEIHDFQELVLKYADTQKNRLDVMISEIIPGDDSSLFHYRSYIDSQGHVLAEMCTQKLRQYPTGYGQASVARTIPLIEEIRDYSLMLLRSFSYQGESSAEFKFDQRDKQYKLMEINIRPVLPEWHFVAAGINFPYLTYLDLVRNVRTISQSYSYGLYWIHNYWEIIYLIESLKSGKLNLSEFLRPYFSKKVFVVPFFDDPIHFIIETYYLGKKVLNRKQKQRF
jgi:predicted ATP-grasp superfamily ATP-dependent carboligase